MCEKPVLLLLLHQGHLRKLDLVHGRQGQSVARTCGEGARVVVVVGRVCGPVAALPLRIGFQPLAYIPLLRMVDLSVITNDGWLFYVVADDDPG